MSGSDIGLVEEVLAERRCRKEAGFGTFAEVSGSLCPVRAASPAGAGTTRWIGTAFEHASCGLPKWVSSIRLMRFNVLLEFIAESLDVSHQTA